MGENLHGALVDTIPLEASGVEARGKSSMDIIPKDSSGQGGLEKGAMAEGSSGQGDLGFEARGEKTENSGKGQDKGTIRVKFNHEERDIDISEAVSLAQQGLKLESILPEYQRLKNNPVIGVLSELEEIAKGRGISVGEYVRQQKEELSGGDVRSGDTSGVCFGVDDYISKGYCQEDAFKLARVDKIIRDDELRQAEFERTCQLEAEKQAENIRQISEFIEIYPEGDARFNEIVTNPDVVLWLAKGYPLSAAYTLSLSKAALAVQKNEDNRGKSSGSIEGNGSHALEFSDDEIAAMSTKDIAKNFKQIMAVIKDRKK